MSIFGRLGRAESKAGRRAGRRAAGAAEDAAESAARRASRRGLRSRAPGFMSTLKGTAFLGALGYGAGGVGDMFASWGALGAEEQFGFVLGTFGTPLLIFGLILLIFWQIKKFIKGTGRAAIKVGKSSVDFAKGKMSTVGDNITNIKESDTFTNFVGKGKGFLQAATNAVQENKGKFGNKFEDIQRKFSTTQKGGGRQIKNLSLNIYFIIFLFFGLVIYHLYEKYTDLLKTRENVLEKINEEEYESIQN